MSDPQTSDRPSEPGWHVDHTTEQLQRWIDTHIPGTPHDRRVIEEDRYPGEPVKEPYPFPADFGTGGGH